MKSTFLNFVFIVLSGGLLFYSCESKAPEPVVMMPLPIKPEEVTINQIQNKLASGEWTIVALVQSYLDRIQEIDKSGPQLNSVLQLNPDALEIARTLDMELKEGKSRGPMHGIPVFLKDNIDTRDKMATTAGSRALAGSRPLQDSYVAKSLREAGAVIMGKANLSEWANFRGNKSTSGWSGLGGQVKNPYRLDCNPCGSSSGSGVAVSANLCVVAIGTETNGSIVCPATANGIVGIKPTVGLISRSGIIPISFTQDTPGPMARTVRDAAICLGAMTGPDQSDVKTLLYKGEVIKDYTPFLKVDGLKGKRIGWYKKTLGINTEVDQLMEQNINLLKAEGVEIIEIDKIAKVPVNDASFQVMLFEFKDGLNKYFDSLGENAPIKSLEELIEFNKKDTIELKHFGQELLIQAQAKGDLNSALYKESLSIMSQSMQRDGIDRLIAEHNLDAFIAPTGSPAWKTDLENGDNYTMGSSSPAAISGYPSITVPMGFIDGLPVGISFFGQAWSEPVLLEMAYAFEQKTQHRKPPEFHTE